MVLEWTGTSSEIECGGCANSIQKALGKLEGITQVEVDVPTKGIKVLYEAGGIEATVIVERLASIGFPVDAS